MANLLHSSKFLAKTQEREQFTNLLFDALREFHKTKDEKFLKMAEQCQERVRELNSELEEMLAAA